jgi:hypothetical protein
MTASVPRPEQSGEPTRRQQGEALAVRALEKHELGDLRRDAGSCLYTGRDLHSVYGDAEEPHGERQKPCKHC